MKSLALAGVANPRSLGDALQCSVMVKLMRKFFPKAELTFFCPNIKSGFFVFKDLNLNARLLDLGPVGGHNVLACTLLPSLLHQGTFKREKKSPGQGSNKKAYMLWRIYQVISKKYGNHITPYVVDKYANSFIMKPFKFDASIFAGHTICGGVYPYIYKYEALRSATEGPMVTSPISISKLALEGYERKNSKFGRDMMLKRLRNSLQKFDFIYARGSYSLKILRDYLNIDERKTAMALDSGFGAKLICPIAKSSETIKKKIRILIIPRKDYFCMYEKEWLYKSYLTSLAELIVWLFRDFGVEVYLTSQTIDVKYVGAQVAINDLLNVLKRHDNSHLKYLKPVKTNDLVTACKLCSSMDLVITSYMHGGITALSSGVPAFFILPSTDIKVLDVLSFVGLDVKSFFVDAFAADALKTENFANKIGKIVDNLKFYKKSVRHSVEKALPTIELPVKKLIELSE